MPDDTTAMCEFFNKQGVVVIRNVLSKADCDATVSEMFDILESGSEFRRDDMSTWNSWPADSIPQYGNISRPPIFTPQFIKNRTNPTLHTVVSNLIGRTDLIANHDRAGFMRPTKSPNSQPQWKTKANLHLDMNPCTWLSDPEGHNQSSVIDALTYDRLSEFINENNQPVRSNGTSVQAVYNLIDNAKEDGGFVCVPRFHTRFADYFSTQSPPANNTPTSPSYNFPRNHELMSQAQRVTSRAGSLIVWDQTLPHGSFSNESGRPRAAQFLRLFPRGVLREDQLRRRFAVVTVEAEKAKGEGIDWTEWEKKALGGDGDFQLYDDV
ncbi:WD repeat-containing protein 26 [Rhizophlyctis rosea]|nr:WD repeat-containing protein 26 [Rhizophlyctis rosea]